MSLFGVVQRGPGGQRVFSHTWADSHTEAGRRITREMQANSTLWAGWTFRLWML